MERTAEPILLATDGSASAQLATEHAIELACATGWPLRVVTGWSIPPSELGSAAVSALPESPRPNASTA